MENVDAAYRTRHLVNPLSLLNSFIRIQEVQAQVFDISFLRAVVEDLPELKVDVGASVLLDCFLERHRFQVTAILKSRGNGWLRFEFEKLVPSSHAHLRSFLSPRKIGESILVDVLCEEMQHYHGLNECELWTNDKGGILFTYLDALAPKLQFMVSVASQEAPLRVGKIAREEYMSLSSLEGDLPLIPLTDTETYSKLGECRDIITNFRPGGPAECVLKQRLLKLVSDTLYSTGKRVDFEVQRPHRMVTRPLES